MKRFIQYLSRNYFTSLEILIKDAIEIARDATRDMSLQNRLKVEDTLDDAVTHLWDLQNAQLELNKAKKTIKKLTKIAIGLFVISAIFILYAFLTVISQ